MTKATRIISLNLGSQTIGLAEFQAQPQGGAATTGNLPSAAMRVGREHDEVSSKQRQVWDSVAVTQRKLSQGLNAPVASPQSTSSLQLALENEKLKEARTAYIGALQPAGESAADIIGYVVAINGKFDVIDSKFRLSPDGKFLATNARPKSNITAVNVYSLDANRIVQTINLDTLFRKWNLNEH